MLGADASEQLGAIEEGLARLDISLQEHLNDIASREMSAAWGAELGKPAGSSLQRSIILSGGAGVGVSGATVAAVTGTDSAPLSGGLVPSAEARAFEFGSLNRDTFTTYTRKARGAANPTPVTRRTKRQMPPRSQTGWIAYPAASRFAVRLIRLYQATIVKFTYDAIDGGR